MDVTELSDDEITQFLSMLHPSAAAMERLLEWLDEYGYRSSQQVLAVLEGAGRIKHRKVKEFPRWELND